MIKLESAKLKAEFVDRVLAGLCIFVAVVLPLSLYKWLVTGFLPIYILNIIIGLALCLSYWRRDQLPFAYKTMLIVCSFILVGLGGVATYGVASNAFVFLVVCGFFCAEVWGKSTALKITLVFFALMAIVAALLVAGQLNIVDIASSQSTSAIGWISSFVPAVLVTLILIHSATEFNNKQQGHAQKWYLKNKHNEQLANYDTLTSLPTLHIAQQRLQEAINFAKHTATKSALLYLDLDGFKQVNDTYGHDAGDAVLQAIASRFNNTIRNSDTCCRIGGDEFLIILPNLQNTQAVHSLCQRIIDEVAKPIEFKSNSLVVGVSIGVALFPDDAINSYELRQKADEAMYQVKQSSKNNYHFYS